MTHPARSCYEIYIPPGFSLKAGRIHAHGGVDQLRYDEPALRREHDVIVKLNAAAAPKTDLRRIFWNHLKVFAAHSATRREFGRVLSFFAASQHKPIIDAIFPLKDAVRAHERLERRKQFGKIVLRIDE